MGEDKKVLVSKKTLIAAGIIVVLLLIIAVLAGMLLGKTGNNDGNDDAAMTQETTEDGLRENDDSTDNFTVTSVKEETLLQEVKQAAYVAVEGSNIYWGQGTALLQGKVDTWGQITDVQKIMDLQEDVRLLLIDGDDFYCNRKDGIYRYEIGNPDGEKLTEKAAYGGFWIMDSTLFFIRDDMLCTLSDSGVEKMLLSSVIDCVVTTKGIYYLTEEAKLFRADLDGTEMEEITPENDTLFAIEVYQDSIYLKGTHVWTYNVSEKICEQLPLREELEKEGNILVTDTYLLYDAASGNHQQFFFDTEQEQKAGYVSNVENPYSVQYNGYLYYTFHSGNLTAVNLATLESQEIEWTEEGSEESTVFSGQDKEEFDIASNLFGRVSDGIASVSSDYIFMIFNYDDYANGLWNVEAIDKRTLRFFYTKADESGYGGTVFTIIAYDWGDNSYADLPNYEVAALSEDKKYIILFPTDVQYNPQDSTQQEEYQRLAEYAKRIKNGNDDNPFGAI